MSQLLAPNYPPLAVSGLSSWSQQFYELFARSTSVSIVTGFASEDSILELTSIVSNLDKLAPKLEFLDFILGMAFFDGLTERQISSLVSLDNELQKNTKGRVRIPLSIAVHSKCSIFKLENEKHALVGSTNFTALIPSRQAELDIYCEPKDGITSQVDSYVSLVMANSRAIDPQILAKIPRIKKENTRLGATPGVDRLSALGIESELVGPTFRLPLKTELKSNLNKFNAAPRGTIPRSWWEIELIVPTSVSRNPAFPSAKNGTNEFVVITDDGFSFECHVSGGNPPNFNKNFESSGDLKVLGYWLKGKLLEKGCLLEGDLVTNETLKEFGVTFVNFTKTSRPGNTWFLELR